MIKLTFCLKRLPHLSLEEFQRYWFDEHGPLVRKHGVALNIKRYVQSHTLDNPLNDAFREGRGGPEAYDGVAQLWWESIESLQAAMETPEGQEAGAALLEDEKTFIDLANSPLWISQERPVIED